MIRARRDGRPQPAEGSTERVGIHQRSALDPTRSREELGFVAEVDLEDGLRRTLRSVIQETRAA